MRIQAVIFDWNGTLFDDLIKLAYGSVVKIFEIHNISPPTLEEYRQEITSRFMDFYYRHGFKENFSGRGAQGDADALNAIRKRYYIENSREGIVRRDAFREVSKLLSAGVKVGIVSAEIESSLLSRLTNDNLGTLVDPRFIKAGVYGDKASALTEMCQRLDVRPESAIYLDDTVDGVNAAQRTGMIPVGFANKTGYNSEARLRTTTKHIIFELSELPFLLESLDQETES